MKRYKFIPKSIVEKLDRFDALAGKKMLIESVIEESKDGAYVLYEDHLAAMEKAREPQSLEATIKRLVSEALAEVKR